MLTQALRFELGKPVDLDEWTLARKRLYDTNVFRLVDIQPVPVGDAGQRRAAGQGGGHGRRVPGSGRSATASSSKASASAELEEFTSTRNAGVVGELRNAEPVRPRADRRRVRHVSARSAGRHRCSCRTSRLFGWRGAVDAVWVLLARSPSRRRRRHRLPRSPISRASAPINAGGRAAVPDRLRLSLRAQSHDRSRIPATMSSPFDIVANLAKLSIAVLFDRRDDPINARKGTFTLDLVRSRGAWLGSDVSNRKLLMQQFVFVPLGRLVLASRVQAGFAFGQRSAAVRRSLPRRRRDQRARLRRRQPRPARFGRPAERRRSAGDPQPGSALPDLSLGERRRCSSTPATSSRTTSRCRGAS